MYRSPPGHGPTLPLRSGPASGLPCSLLALSGPLTWVGITPPSSMGSQPVAADYEHPPCREVSQYIFRSPPCGNQRTDK